VEGGVDESTFWRLIESFDWDKTGDDDGVVEPAVRSLARMSESEISAFQNTLASKLYALDGRAWARESGYGVWWGEPDELSVDGFLYARCVVVANGREFFDSVLNDPTHMPKDMEFESLLYVAGKALQRKTGREDAETDEPGVSFETFSNRAGWA
jgi:hypothetical protein